jgi:hypothetical protein
MTVNMRKGGSKRRCKIQFEINSPVILSVTKMRRKARDENEEEKQREAQVFDSHED